MVDKVDRDRVAENIEHIEDIEGIEDIEEKRIGIGEAVPVGVVIDIVIGNSHFEDRSVNYLDSLDYNSFQLGFHWLLSFEL